MNSAGGRLPKNSVRGLCFAVALCSLATILLELTLTRIFSVVFYYHFAFLAISIALFGLGAGGIVSYRFGVPGGPASIGARLGLLSTLNMPIAAVMLWAVLAQPLGPPSR